MILWIGIIILNKFLLVRTDLLRSINSIRIFVYYCFDSYRSYLIIGMSGVRRKKQIINFAYRPRSYSKDFIILCVFTQYFHRISCLINSLIDVLLRNAS